MGSSTLIETININADDFTDNFLTCPTCMSPYDENEHTPKLLPCSHTLCRSCLERIAATATAVVPANTSASMDSHHHHHHQTGGSTLITNNSIARSIAAADAAAAAMTLANTISPSSSSSNSQLNESPRLNVNGNSIGSSRLSSSSLTSSSNRNSSGGNLHPTWVCFIFYSGI